MRASFNITLDEDNIINVINLLDQNEVDLEIDPGDEDDLYFGFVRDKKFNEIEFFIDRGEKIKKFMEFCNENDDESVLHFLFEKMDDIDKENSFKYIIKNLNISNIKYFFNQFLEKNKLKELIKTISHELMSQLIRDNKNDLIILLLKKGLKIKKFNEDPIVTAITHSNTEIIKYLLKHGSDIKYILPMHLEHCLRDNHYESIEYIKDNLYNNRLHHFVSYDNSKCFELAINKNRLDVVIALLVAGTDIGNTLDNLCYKLTDSNNKLIKFLFILKKYRKKEYVNITSEKIIIDFNE